MSSVWPTGGIAHECEHELMCLEEYAFGLGVVCVKFYIEQDFDNFYPASAEERMRVDVILRDGAEKNWVKILSWKKDYMGAMLRRLACWERGDAREKL